MAETQMEI
jgi:hypothetical protein